MTAPGMQAWRYAEQWAEAKPSSEVLAFGDERVTWHDLRGRVDRTAKALLEAGVEPGDRVAMLAMARCEFLTTFLAAGKIGAVWLGLSPKSALAELRYILDDARPRVLVALRDYLGADLSGTVATLMAEFPCLERVLVLGEPFAGTERFGEIVAAERGELDELLARRAAEVADDDLALLLYTSGSTGKPKGVLHTHRSMHENAKVEVEKFLLDQASRILLHFPINHVAAVVEIGLAGIMAGSFLLLADRFDPAESLRAVERERLTFLGQIPAMFLLQFSDPQFAKTDLSSIRQFVWAGAAAPKPMVDILAGICARTGAIMLTGYGSTETGGFVTYTDPTDSEDVLLTTAGRIAEPFELAIVDERRRELPDGSIGEIAVRGPFLMKGYLGNPEATGAVIDGDGWFYTSDLALRDADGCIHIAGRTSEMYKSGGENVYPREIEDAIAMHEGVLLSAVIGVPDDVYQEVGWAFVMAKPDAVVGEDELRELCRSRMANFKVPKRFFIRTALALLPNGKVDKTALREEVAATRRAE